MKVLKYYSVRGKYLEEHKAYFSQKQLRKEVGFLIDKLQIKKRDKILDLACGHGRHVIALNLQGYDVDGLDYSGHLLKMAREQALKEGLAVDFYQQDINKINLYTKYDKIFLFFSEFGLFNANKVLKGVVKSLKPRGLFLLDCDNPFRLVGYLRDHPKSPARFDFVNMEFHGKHSEGRGIRYYTPMELLNLFNANGLDVVSVCGNYDGDALGLRSRRVVLVGKKRARN